MLYRTIKDRSLKISIKKSLLDYYFKFKINIKSDFLLEAIMSIFRKTTHFHHFNNYVLHLK